MEHFELTTQIIFILFSTGILAGFIDSIAGGGGLISVPVLLSVGLPAQLALGTNKLQGSFGAFSAALYYIRKRQVCFKEARLGIIMTLIGAALGAALVQILSTEFIRHLIPVMLLLIFIYTLISPKLGYEESYARISHFWFSIIFGLALGFYDGFFGPGAGSFWTMAYVSIMGMNMIRACGYTKVMNFTSNIVALVVFMVGGNVLYSVGLIMALGQIIGATIGSKMAIKNGVKFIRPVFLMVVLLTIVRLVYNNYA